MTDSADNNGTPTVTTSPVPGGLIPQPHGGALRPGGKVGNRGGKGRPAKEVQSRSRRLYDMVLTRLARKLNDESNPLDVSELVAAGNMAGKHSGLASETVKVEVALLPIEERKRRIAQIVAKAAARVQGPPRTVHGWHGEYVTTEVEGLAENPLVPDE